MDVGGRTGDGEGKDGCAKNVLHGELLLGLLGFT